MLGVDEEFAQRNWQIEQRLGSITTALDQGVIDQATADQYELEALHELRKSTVRHGMRVSLGEIYRQVETEGYEPINVPKNTGADYRGAR